MQALQLALIAAGALVVVALLAVRYQRHERGEDLPVRLLIGIVPGIAAAVIVLTNRIDIVPDEAEPTAWAAVIVVVSIAIVLATSYRLARH